MTNGFYLQNFLYLYSRNKHVIMENTRIKLSETVMVIDAAYLNFVINDLKKYFEPLLGRSLQRADLALFTMCLAMDAGVKEGSNDVQILLVYDEQSGKLEDCLPSDLKSELDGMAFKGPLGEFCFMAVSSEGFVSRGELYLDLLHIVLNSAEVKKLIVVPFNEEFGGMLGLRVNDLVGQEGITKKDLIPFTYPSDEELKRVGVTGIFLGYYIPWEGLHNVLVAKAHGFESWGKVVEGDYDDYENLDNYQAGIHEYFKFLKFGFGRCSDQASMHIRRGRISRDEAMKIVKERDGAFRWTYLDKKLEDILEPLDITVDEFIKVCDEFTNKKLFLTDKNGKLIKDKKGNLTKINYDNVEEDH